MQNLLEDFGIIDEARELTSDMLVFSRDSLLTSLKFTNRPTAQLPMRVATDRTGCATNGREALFSPSFVLDAYRNAPGLIARAYLHMLLHCLLRHNILPPDADPLRWSVAADLATAAIIRTLECPAIAFADDERDAVLDQWLSRVEQPTAAAFYALLNAEKVSEEELGRIEIVIGMDGHDLWLPQGVDPDSEDEDDPDADPQDNEAQKQMQQRWEQIARETRMDMEREEQSTDTSSLKDALGSLEAEAMSLDDLLRAYAAPREVMKVSDDEFDYIYYTYGLSQLGKPPLALIEPLEYAEDHSLRDFVIAIDTSGSVQGPLVKSFLRKACGALLETDALGASSRIRIVQCDNRIQREDIVTSHEDVKAYLQDVELQGLGGTDFRPVFSRMEQLQESGEITEWEGLIYFTDGKGEFPAQAPLFDAAFVFVDEAGDVPLWATKVLAYSDELAQEPGTQAQP